MKGSILSILVATANISFGDPVVSTTIPVGYVKMGQSAYSELPAVGAECDAYLTIPLIKPPTLKATVVSVSGSAVILTSEFSPSFLVGPHYFVVESGPKKGLIGLVTSTTSNSVVVALEPDETMADIISGVIVSLRPAWTAKNVFQEVVPTGSQMGFWINNRNYNSPANIVLQFDGADWRKVGDSSLQNDFVLYPTETFMLRTTSSSIPRLSIAGEVSLNPSRAFISNAPYPTKLNYVSFFSAIDEPILTSGIMGFAQNSDQIYIPYSYFQSHNGSMVFMLLDYQNGSLWDAYAEVIADGSYTFKAGAGIIYNRRSHQVLPTVLWYDSPNFLPVH